MELLETNFKGVLNMLYFDYTKELTGLQGIIIEKIERNDLTTTIHIKMERKLTKCPCCGELTDTIHDYRTQLVKDIPAFGNNVILSIKKRRYRCLYCNKRFIEDISFLPRYYRMTNRLTMYILDKLGEERSFSSVAHEVQLSVSTVIRVFDLVSYIAPKSLPSVIAIDEFKGNTGDEKYQCILTNPQTGEILDILPTRNSSDLIKYLKKYTLEERCNVKYFVSDMWKPYADLSTIFFKSATQIIDKYHFVRQCVWAFENVRKQEQKKYSAQCRKLFKNSKRILTKRYSKLNDAEKQRLNSVLYISSELLCAYRLKEDFYRILDCEDRETAKQMMSDWIVAAQNSQLTEYEKCASTMINWQTGILNSFTVPYTNGFTEGCNNRIKVIKRISYGYRNFKRFRNRILHIFRNQHPERYKTKVAA